MLRECLSVVVGVVNCLTARLRLIRPFVVHIRRDARGQARRVSGRNPVWPDHGDTVLSAPGFVCNRSVHKFRGDDPQETRGPEPRKWVGSPTVVGSHNFGPLRPTCPVFVTPGFHCLSPYFKPIHKIVLLNLFVIICNSFYVVTSRNGIMGPT